MPAPALDLKMHAGSADVVAGMAPGMVLPTAEEIATLPARTIERIHRYSAELPPSPARAALEDALRPRLRATRPPKVLTPMRLFCLPFEDLLTDRNPRVRPAGLIPRRILMPFWRLLTRPATVPGLLRGPTEEFPLPLRPDRDALDHPLFEAGRGTLSAMRSAAVGNPAIANVGKRIHPDIWDIVPEMDLAIGLRFDLWRIRQDLARGRTDPAVSEFLRAAADDALAMHVLLLSLARSPLSRGAFPDFATALGRHRSKEVVRILSDIVRCTADDARQDIGLETAEEAARDLDPPSLARGLRPAAERLAVLRAQPMGRAGTAAAERLGEDLKATVRDRLMPNVDGMIERLPAMPRTRDESEFVAALSAAVEMLSVGREVCAGAGFADMTAASVERLMAATRRRIAALARPDPDTGSGILAGAAPAPGSPPDPAPDPALADRALRVAARAAHAFEQLCPQESVLTFLQTAFVDATGRPAPKTREAFLSEIVRSCCAPARGG
ncbi:hypothetical protein JL100_028040 [Skermanella mucosa]|uniref:hypothetical protein n=1 Tax=Skermanella mucosa TaxID=1789672 RepID=UPI00192BB80E|nr:hypothetical protein [Skermanella mucosa]UEM20873.1 hypothetical protein JL100_028040 [Skermanella mucosa]